MDTFLYSEPQTLLYFQPRFTDTGYLRTVYSHCVLIVNIVLCSKNEFLWVNTILFHYSARLSSAVWPYYCGSFKNVFCLPINHFHLLGFLLQSLVAPLYLYIDNVYVVNNRYWILCSFSFYLGLFSISRARSNELYCKLLGVYVYK